MNYEELIAVARKWFLYWVQGEEKQEWMFNEVTIPLELLAYVYGCLAVMKKVTRLENLDAEYKAELKKTVFSVDKNCSAEKGVKIAKAIHVFAYVSEL